MFLFSNKYFFFTDFVESTVSFDDSTTIFWRNLKVYNSQSAEWKKNDDFFSPFFEIA